MAGERIDQLRNAAASWQAAQFGAGSFDPSRWPPISIASSQVSHLEAAVSPDCSYRLVKAAIDAAHEEVCLYIYNVSADHLLDLLRDAKARGVRIRLMYDVTDTRGGERNALASLGVELKEAPSAGDRKVFTVCHQKFAVIDSATLLIGSANWAGTAFPEVTIPGRFKKGNREWVIRIDEPSLATWFRALFEADWDIPALVQPGGLVAAPPVPLEPTFVPALLVEMPDEIFDTKRIDLAEPCKVTPILSPNNYLTLARKLIDEATASIDIEQQYIVAGGPDTEALLAALERRRDELTIRIIVSPAFRNVGGPDSWERTVDSLAAFHLEDRLRAMNLRFYTHLHNKGLIVDREKVIVSSTNWSENSIARAREAGVLIESPAVASYYAVVFDFDWSIGWDAADVPANLVQAFQEAMFVPGGFEEIHPADMA
jgi:phosphatidylserine/phosphatidylglycerophosphate/cardiolipin synthase-like enzyme